MQVCSAAGKCEDPFVKPIEMTVRDVTFGSFWKGQAWDQYEEIGLLQVLGADDPGDACGNGGAAPAPAVRFGLVTGDRTSDQMNNDFLPHAGSGPGKSGFVCNTLSLNGQQIVGAVSLTPYGKVWVTAFDWDRRPGANPLFRLASDFQSAMCVCTAPAIMEVLRSGHTKLCKSDFSDISFSVEFRSPFVNDMRQ
jgi:hypothetical protein